MKIAFGKYTISMTDYADHAWIYKDDGEGMALNKTGEKSLYEAIEKAIEGFYNEHF